MVMYLNLHMGLEQKRQKAENSPDESETGPRVSPTCTFYGWHERKQSGCCTLDSAEHSSCQCVVFFSRTLLVSLLSQCCSSTVFHSCQTIIATSQNATALVRQIFNMYNPTHMG